MNTVNLTHLKTIYKGCTPDGTKADPSRSDVVRLCRHSAHSHATLSATICPAFLNAQQIADEKINDKPYHISILWTVPIEEKRKPENAETGYETMLYFIENFMTPTNGVVVSIYHCHSAYPHHTTQYKHSQYWPFEKQWSPKNEYITIHKAEPLMSQTRIKGVKESQMVMLPLIENNAIRYGYDIKYIDYTMTTKEIIETMTYSDYHFCYSGATYYTACMIGIPALAWHHHNLNVIRYNEHKYTRIDKVDRFVPISSIETLGRMSVNPAHIRQYDFEKQRVDSFPMERQKHMVQIQEIEEAFLRMIK